MPFFRCNQVMHPHKRSCLSVGLFLSLFFFLFLFSFLLSRTERALSKVYDTDRGRCGRKVECTDPLRHILWRTIEARVRCFISKEVFHTSIFNSVCLYVHYLSWLSNVHQSVCLFIRPKLQNGRESTCIENYCQWDHYFFGRPICFCFRFCHLTSFLQSFRVCASKDLVTPTKSSALALVCIPPQSAFFWRSGRASLQIIYKSFKEAPEASESRTGHPQSPQKILMVFHWLMLY